ncbi:MAG: hypothetical protein ABIO19_12320 [Burkholderiaceae bacterium]
MLPKASKEEREEEEAATMARETLYEGVEKNAQPDRLPALIRWSDLRYAVPLRGACPSHFFP